MKLRYPLILLATALGGCTVGPDYQRPEMDMIENRYHLPVAEKSADSLASVEWFEVFSDPYLEKLIRTALAQNPDLGVALARIDEAQARTVVSRSAFGPDIRGAINTAPTPGGAGNDATFNSGVGFSWELDIFGKIRRANEATQAQLLATEDGARAVMSTLVVGVARTWFTLLELDEEVRILERTVASQERSLALVRSQMSSGVSSKAEEQQAIAQLASTRAELPAARRSVAYAESTLAILLGQGPRRFNDRPQGGTSQKIDTTDLALGLPVELLERRPDIRRAEQQLHAATASVGVAVANRFPFPTIGLSGFFGSYAVDFGDIGDSGNSVNFSGWGPYMDLPIVDWGRAKGNEQAARAVTKQAVHNYRKTVLGALKEVSDSVYAFKYSAEVIEANQIFSTAAKNGLELQRSRFTNGLVGYLDVLDSERQLLSAELSLARAQLGRAVAYLDIYRSLGGGWSDADLTVLARTREKTGD